MIWLIPRLWRFIAAVVRRMSSALGTPTAKRTESRASNVNDA
jgi:hypothetical protein